MARRSHSSISPLLIGIAIVVIIAGIIGVRYFAVGAGQPYRKYEKLEVQTYLENSNSLRGNSYRVEGEILNDLAWSPTQGRLFSLELEKKLAVIPVLIPTSLNNVNIQKGQRFIILLEVMDNGLLQVREMTKT